MTGTHRLTKLGAGTLTLSGSARQLGETEIEAGLLRLAEGAEIARNVAIGTGQMLEIVGSSAVGSLTGSGSVSLTAGALTIGSMDADVNFSGVISGSGSLVITGGTTGGFIRRLSRENTFSGGVTL